MGRPKHERLKRLVTLQQRVKALHDARHAAHLTEARVAEQEAAALIESLNDPKGVAALFPALVHARIASALARRDASWKEAAREAGESAAARARVERAGQAYRQALGQHERALEAKTILELLEQRLSRKAGG